MAWKLEEMRGVPPTETREILMTCDVPGWELDALYMERDRLQAEALKTKTMTELRYGVNPT